MNTHVMTRALAPIVALGLAAPALGQGQTYVFSLDIGSDTEISDPFGGAGELADPGDVYRSSGTAGSLAGAPWLDDSAIFGGADPAPQQGVVASAVPVGNVAASYSDYFDLDGYDSLDMRLAEFDLNPDTPLQAPIWRQGVASDCVYDGRHLAVSFNDDPPRGWRAANPPRVPTEGPSPLGVTYGSVAGQDEVVALDVALGAGFPAPLNAVIPVANETTVHIDLAGNPPAAGEDDDVDALDRTLSDACAVHLFSADSEGRLNLNPGTIYEVVPGAAPAPTITNVHLGIAASADIDAFEIVWLPHPTNQQGALAIVFSVKADDPGTAIDESGGLVPATIYASFLTGASFVFVSGPANSLDDVDAIAATAEPPVDSDGDGVPDSADNCTNVPNPMQRDTDGDGYGNWCDGDLDQNCITNTLDLAIFKLRFFTTDPHADFNGDGIVNAADLGIMRLLFFLPPGPSGFATLCP